MRITDSLTLFNEMFGHGKAVFSIVSTRTQNRKTFQVERAPERRGSGLAWFVSQLTGPDNRLSYTYLLMVTARGNEDVPQMRLTAKSPVGGFDHEAVRSFRWLFRNAIRDLDTLGQAEVWLACNCSRCGRLLTVPESIAVRLGPYCRGVS
mgnify:CR=1 FL=1